jgi:hypothetical protein
MNKLNKILGISGSALLAGAITVAGIAPTFAITDGGAGDINSVAGEISDTQLIQVASNSEFVLDVSSTGLVETIDANGTTASLSGSYGTGPADMEVTAIGTPVDSYSNFVIRTNNAAGYSAYIMMCTSSAQTPFSAVSGCNDSQNLVSAGSSTYIAPTTPGAALTGTGAGGYWGYRSSTTTSGDAAATAPTGNWAVVPAFSAASPYGTQLLDTNAAGASAVNLNYGAVTNATLDGGRNYSNYVIYTAVAK